MRAQTLGRSSDGTTCTPAVVPRTDPRVLRLDDEHFEHERFTRRTLEETDRLRTALFQSASHDLRTPLFLPHTPIMVISAFGEESIKVSAVEESAVLERGPLTIDLAEHRVLRGGEPIALTPTQFDLLACFARHPGKLLTHRTIMAEVWGDPDAADAQNLRVFVSQLRRKIEEDARAPRLIVTDPGVGYRFLPSA